MINWFPLGIASGEAFCNRNEERQHLKYNFSHTIHSLIMAPRRYGKTSVALKAIEEIGFPNCLIEFTLASDSQTVQNIISSAIGVLIYKLMPAHKKALELAKKFFSMLHPELVLDSEYGARIKFNPAFDATDSRIDEILTSVDNLAQELGKQAIIFMDEFQQIANIPDNQVIEAAVRNAAQKMKNISIVFSGSNRHLLQMMFDDSARPLYHLCDRINLSRINELDYAKYLQNAAKYRWNEFLSETVIDKILLTTARHPYYVNVLCSRLWRFEYVPDIEAIAKIWDEYVVEEQYRIVNEVGKLGQHQKLMLMLLSVAAFKQPTSKEVLSKMRASAGSAVKSLKSLLNNDYIYKGEDGYYKILDPAIASYLRKESRMVL